MVEGFAAGSRDLLFCFLLLTVCQSIPALALDAGNAGQSPDISSETSVEGEVSSSKLFVEIVDELFVLIFNDLVVGGADPVAASNELETICECDGGVVGGVDDLVLSRSVTSPECDVLPGALSGSRFPLLFMMQRSGTS